jgi:GT2 family glycosyltransferase
VEIGADWTWLMDDDTIPNADALEKLMLRSAVIPNTGFLCSRVLWTDGTVHKSNNKCPDQNPHGRMYNQYIDAGVLLIPTCSFVSCLVHQDAVAAVGYPISDFFIWADDVEYTNRISSAGFLGLYIWESVVVHKTSQNISISLSDMPAVAFFKVYYDQRNRVYMLRKKYPFPLRFLYMYAKTLMANSVQCLKNKNGRFKLLRITLRGMLAGFFFYPKVESA